MIQQSLAIPCVDDAAMSVIGLAQHQTLCQAPDSGFRFEIRQFAQMLLSVGRYSGV
jgi:hypothetical protein